MLTQERLKELLNYDETTGLFTWNTSSVGRKRGKKAGCLLRNGSIQIMLEYQKYSAHRIAFLYMTGRMPVEVDHINGNPSDNRWCNLREVSHSENLLNRRLMKNSSTGVKNVSWRKDRNCFVVTMLVQGKRKVIGHRKTLEEASNLATEAREKYHGEFARHA